jgi:hypothetical protein
MPFNKIRGMGSDIPRGLANDLDVAHDGILELLVRQEGFP